MDRWLHWRRVNGLPAELGAFTAEEVQRYLDAMETEGRAPATRDGAWRCIKALWRLLLRRKLLEEHQLDMFGPDGVVRPRIPDKIPRIYTDAEIEALLAVAGGSSWHPEGAARNQAIILLLWQTGCRAAELCSLNDQAVNLVDRMATIRGKGDKPRWLFWHERAATALAAYLSLRQGASVGPLFRDLETGERISYSALRSMLQRTAQRAGVTLIQHAPMHGFRYKFAHDALASGIADLDLQQLLGHSSIVSTQRYTRKDPGKLAEVHRKIKF
jgi:site-specific recombinase XerD